MRFALSVVMGGVVVLAGCSVGGLNQATTAQSGVSGTKLTGSVHGGQQPISGAHVYLFAANTAILYSAGNPATPVTNGQTSVSLLNSAQTGASDSIGAYVTTNAAGNFTITGDYTCTPGAQVYLYGLGGDPGGGINSAAGLMAALGTCPSTGDFSTTTPFISVNEVSTVAAAYSLADFATDATHVWGTGTNDSVSGIANAFANTANLVNLGTGAALTMTPSGTSTVPQAEIDTLGNILAACVNSTGPGSSACSMLFSYAPSGGSTPTTPTDTAAAAINIAKNPGVHVADLYRISNPSPPFQPALTAQPTDFSIPLVATPTPASYFRNSLNSTTVFMGDSITQYWNLPLNNAGFHGELASDMLARFSTDVLGHGYTRVVILAGTNDIWLLSQPDPAVALQDIEQMAAMGRAAGIQVILCTLPANLSNPSFYAPLYGPFNQSLTDFATANNYPIVDYYTPTLGHPEYYITGDLVHPNAAGYAVMEQALAAVVTQ